MCDKEWYIPFFVAYYLNYISCDITLNLIAQISPNTHIACPISVVLLSRCKNHLIHHHK